jgi:hypothetical protein
MTTNRAISITKWFEEFKPVDGGAIFEDVAKGTDPLTVWTVINADGYESIESGYHFINRMGYHITEVARKEDEVISVYEDWLIKRFIKKGGKSAREHYEL